MRGIAWTLPRAPPPLTHCNVDFDWSRVRHESSGLGGCPDAVEGGKRAPLHRTTPQVGEIVLMSVPKYFCRRDDVTRDSFDIFTLCDTQRALPWAKRARRGRGHVPEWRDAERPVDNCSAELRNDQLTRSGEFDPDLAPNAPRAGPVNIFGHFFGPRPPHGPP